MLLCAASHRLDRSRITPNILPACLYATSNKLHMCPGPGTGCIVRKQPTLLSWLQLLGLKAVNIF